MVPLEIEAEQGAEDWLPVRTTASENRPIIEAVRRDDGQGSSHGPIFLETEGGRGDE